MKKRTNKGMALASTLIMMTIVMMMSALMMTVSLYGSQVASLQSQNVEDRRVLDDIGNRFLKNKDDPAKFLKYYIDKSADDNSGISMRYYNAHGNPTNEPQTVIKGECNGMRLIFNVKETAGSCTLTVSGLRRSNQLMKIVCQKTTDARTGVVTSELKSWAYAGD